MKIMSRSILDRSLQDVVNAYLMHQPCWQSESLLASTNFKPVHLDAAERVLKKVEPDAGKLDKVRQTLSVHRGKTEALRGQVLALKNHLKLSD